MAISETKKVRRGELVKASDTLISTLAAFSFSSHSKRKRDREAPTTGGDNHHTARQN